MAKQETNIQEEDKKVTTTTENKPSTKKEEMVQVPASQLENMLERLSNLENKETKSKIADISRNKTCRVRFIGDKVVIGYGKSYDKRMVDGGHVLMMEVITEDYKKHEVEFVEFHDTGVQETAEILKIDAKEKVEEKGYVYATAVEYDSFRSYETNKQVPLIVKSIKSLFTVKLPDGRELVLPEEAIN